MQSFLNKGDSEAKYLEHRFSSVEVQCSYMITSTIDVEHAERTARAV